MNRQETEKKVLEFMKKYHMADGGDCILAAVSGGADSVCLLIILAELRKTLGIRLYAMHMNHGLRGEEADRDEAYTEELCRRLDVPCRVVHEDVRSLAAQKGMSLEEAGRELRYRHLREEAERSGCSRIAVAHHMDDSVETVLFHLFRGSGLHGLSGIRPVRGNIIRPLLCLRRKETEGYLKELDIGWCEDSTNRLTDYARNRLRNELMPWAEEKINPRAAEHVLAASALAQQADEYFESLAETLLSEERKQKVAAGAVRRETLERQPEIIKTYVIRALIAEAAGENRDISSRHMEGILAMTGPGGGTRLMLPGGLTAGKDQRFLRIRKEGPSEERQLPEICLQLPEKGGYLEKELPGGRGTAFLRAFSWEKDREIPKNQYTKWFDYAKIKDTLFVRTRKEGDFFLISGGKKKNLRRYLIDEKIPEEERGQILLLAEGHHILWVIGRRISEYYKITEETETILEIRIGKGEEGYGG